MYLKNQANPITRRQFSKHQTGLSLAILLFIIIILSLLAASLIRLNSQSTLANAQEVIASRAFFAAESGAQRQAMNLFPVSGGAAICIAENYSFTTPGLNNCTANTSCTPITVGSDTYYQVISVGRCNTGQPLSATRTIEVRLKELN